MESEIRNLGNALTATTGIKVFVERHCWTKMYGWCRAANSEVSGLGLAYIDDKGNFHVYEVYLPKQQCSSSYTDIDDDAVGKLSFSLHKKKKDQRHFRFWWHTHYNFGVFWSGTDDTTAKRLLSFNNEWMLSLVINQAGHYKCRLDMMGPDEGIVRGIPVKFKERAYINIDDLPVEVKNNTVKRKRKRNFKSDIKKWVRPIEYRKPETSSYCPQTAQSQRWDHGWPSGHGYVIPGHPSMGGQTQMDEWWQHYEKHNEKKDEPKPEEGPPKLIKITDTPKEAPKAGFLKGGKVWSNVLQRIVPFDVFLAMKDCPCKHVGDWGDCECNVKCEICIERLSLHLGHGG